jgi:hypothetical protein
MRSDISIALGKLPADIKAQVTTSASRCLELIDAYLPSGELVKDLASASVNPGSPSVCLFALTDQRLIFLAPLPQVVAWRLAGLKKASAYAGYFFVDGDAGEYSLNMDEKWGPVFETHVLEAAAIATLANGNVPVTTDA